MNATILDASDYLRGLLILIRRDGRITPKESEVIARAGRHLGFEERFCAQAVAEILENGFIDETPPVFSSPGLAKKFVTDALRAAYIDRQLDDREEQWLQSTVERNGCGAQWFADERHRTVSASSADSPWEFESINVKHAGQ
jgi:hypothetical protein